MKQQMCSRCHERPAVVFIQKMENDKVVPEGFVLNVQGNSMSALSIR